MQKDYMDLFEVHKMHLKLQNFKMNFTLQGLVLLEKAKNGSKCLFGSEPLSVTQLPL